MKDSFSSIYFVVIMSNYQSIYHRYIVYRYLTNNNVWDFSLPFYAISMAMGTEFQNVPDLFNNYNIIFAKN